MMFFWISKVPPPKAALRPSVMGRKGKVDQPIRFESPTLPKKGVWKLTQKSGCLNILKDELDTKCLICLHLENLGGL